jgi:hypothetical protein
MANAARGVWECGNRLQNDLLDRQSGGLISEQGASKGTRS